VGRVRRGNFRTSRSRNENNNNNNSYKNNKTNIRAREIRLHYNHECCFCYITTLRYIVLLVRVTTCNNNDIIQDL